MNTVDNTLEDLLAAIRSAATQPDLEWAQPPEVLVGGFWAQMWRVRLAGAHGDLSGDLVVRVMPHSADGARETATQTHLANVGYPTPAVHLAAAPGTELDRAWMLMDFAPGKPLLAGLSGPAALLGLPRVAHQMPDQLARHAAMLHKIDAGPLRTDEDQIAALVRGIRDQCQTIDRSDLADVATWLGHHRPPVGSTVICHGDLHPFNVLTDPSGDTVLDWSSTRIADPAYDVAFAHLLLSQPPLTAPRLIKPMISVTGRVLARRLLRSYDRAADTPVDPAQMDWFTLIHALRMVTELNTWRAQDEVEQHSGHPFLSLEGPFIDQIISATGISVAAGM